MGYSEGLLVGNKIYEKLYYSCPKCFGKGTKNYPVKEVICKPLGIIPFVVTHYEEKHCTVCKGAGKLVRLGRLLHE